MTMFDLLRYAIRNHNNTIAKKIIDSGYWEQLGECDRIFVKTTIACSNNTFIAEYLGYRIYKNLQDPRGDVHFPEYQLVKL